MGRSAKLHKRVPKKPKLHGHGNPMSNAQPVLQSQAQTAKKKATIKRQLGAGKSEPETGEGVLGGADYVTLMMGGRRKARQEAEKLPPGEPS